MAVAERPKVFFNFLYLLGLRMKYDVISFGSAILDVFIKSPEIKISKSENAYAPEMLILPYKAKVEVSDLTICSGGGGANTAVGFARLGLRTAVVARCGWDFAGKLIRREIKKEGVYDELLVQLEGEKTDYSTILRGPDGNRTILVYRGSTRLERSVIDFKKLNSFWFYIASLEGNLDLLSTLVDYARENHTKVALNPGIREIEEREKLLSIASGADVLIVNREEAEKLLGLSHRDKEVFRKMHQRFPGVITMVTDGENGATAIVPERGYLFMAAPNTLVVEQTGAGDAFGAGFITGLIKGWDIERAMKLGISNGAAVVMKVGAKAGLIKEEEADYWLQAEIPFRWTPYEP